jgi:hypothetical protein
VKRYLGKFEINRSWIEDCPEEVIKCLEGILIWRAETLGYKDTIEYIGMSKEKFPLEVERGSLVPIYKIETSLEQEGEGDNISYTTKFVKFKLQSA